MVSHTLRPIRNVYVALHQDTNSAPTQFSATTGDQDDVLRQPSSYLSCKVNGHIHESASTTLARTFLRVDAAQPPTSLASTDAPSSSIPTPSHVDEIAHQTVLHIPAASPDPVTASVVQGGLDRSTTTTNFPTVEPSASAPSMAPTFPGGFVVPHIADRRTSLEVLNVPSLPSPAPVLDNILPTEAHRSLLAPASLGPSHPHPSSAPGPGAATEAEGEGSAKVALHNERDLPAILENVMTTPDLLPQLPSPSVTDEATAGPSWHPLGIDRTGHHPPRPSHDQYDIV
ncbi:hypothetical protein H4582DRAFT_2132996 [Lactarius indigo]|nr:hypothetical protein H4582DRAFT_2132996 [Lactarius indigo]